MKKKYSTSKNTCKVTFSLPSEAVNGAESVILLGDFNEWHTDKALSLKPQKDGSFKGQLELTTGSSYEFRYLIDGSRWENDYHADKYVPSPFYGIDNGVVELAAKVKTKKAAKDDLKKIEGIGPKICKLLNEDGIITFSDLANAPLNQLEAILEAAGPRFKMHKPTTWAEQSKLAAEGAWEELKELQDRLHGGR